MDLANINKYLDKIVDERGIRTYMDINISTGTYVKLAVTLVAAGTAIILVGALAKMVFKGKA